MQKKIKIILVIGLLLRLLLGAITYHSDIVPFPFVGRVFAEGNVLNLYDFLWNKPADSPELKVYPRDLFNYPPATYFFLGGSSLVLTAPISTFVDDFIYSLQSNLGDPRFNILLVLLKLPYVPFDIAVAFLLMKFFTKERDKLLAFTLWMFNPVNLYATYMMGMYEIIPTFFVIMSLYVITKNQKAIGKSSLLLGLGAAFKIFPVLFLVPLSSVTDNWKEKLKAVGIGIGIYVLTILPFLASPGFRRTALLAGQTTKSLYLTWPLSGGEAIIPFLALIVFFYIVFTVKKCSPSNLWKRYFVLLILFFAMTHYHPQWFLWITPFLIMDLIHTNFKHLPVTLTALLSYVALISFFDPGLSIGLFAPIVPNLYRSPGIWQLLGINVDINMMRSVFQTLFVGAGLYWVYYYFKPGEES